MNLYLVSQDYNNGYDTFDSMVISAESEEKARQFHPKETFNTLYTQEELWKDASESMYSTWCRTPDQAKVELIGTSSVPEGIVITSFNAG